MEYPIHNNGDQIGSALVETQGLFLVITCRCNRDNKQPYFLYLNSNSTQIALGVCPPGSYLIKRLSAKMAGGEGISFSASSLTDSDNCVILNTTQPFPHLHRLPQAYLRQSEMKHYIAFRHSAAD